MVMAIKVGTYAEFDPDKKPHYDGYPYEDRNRSLDSARRDLGLAGLEIDKGEWLG
jgi:hypothetical protein